MFGFDLVAAMDEKPDTMDDLLVEVRRLNKHRFVQAHDSWFGLFFFNLIRGLAFGLGSVVGATVLVSVLVYFLSTVDFIPIIGDYASQVIELIQTEN